MSGEYRVVVVGAGVVGLAVARLLVRRTAGVLVLERHESFGRETSSRNSEVVHGGIYYGRGSRKARHCVRGRILLYELCARFGLPHRRTGKVIVAGAGEEAALEKLHDQARGNGVDDVRLLDASEVRALEPRVLAQAGLLSPSTGIVDAHAVMKHCAAAVRAGGGDLAFHTRLEAAEPVPGGYRLVVRDAEGELFSFEAPCVVNAAGLDADTVARMFGIDCEAAGYALHYVKGHYFRYVGPPLGIERLVYPVPRDVGKGLGVHLVLDLAGQARFGPDAVHLGRREQDYRVDPGLQDAFHRAVAAYLPCIEPEQLAPDMSGIRPKLSGPGEPARDFVVAHEADRGLPGLVNLVGIDSPGLTSCLALAEEVESLLHGAL